MELFLHFSGNDKDKSEFIKLATLYSKESIFDLLKIYFQNLFDTDNYAIFLSFF